LKKKDLVSKSELITVIAKKAGISKKKALIAYECILAETPSFRKQALKTVSAKKEVLVKVAGKTVIKKVQLKRDKPIKSTVTKEKLKKVEIIKRVLVPVEKIVEKIKEVEVIKEVLVPVEKVVEVVKEVEVIKEILVEKIVEKIKAVEVIKEVPVEVIKEITLIKEIPVIKEVEVVKEIPVEIIREVEVVKQVDFATLTKMIAGMKTVEISKKVIGETRTKKEAKVVERREVKAGTNTALKGVKKPPAEIAAKTIKTPTKKFTDKAKVKADDLTKIEGIGPKIAGLLKADGIASFKALAASKPDNVKNILLKAGSRYQMHHPTTWPKQAQLAADGKWKALEKLQAELSGGK